MRLPGLRLADWRPTKDTLHLYCQILGKVRLATTSPRNHWWNVPLYVDVHGLTTRRLHHEGAAFELAIDFLDDALVVRSGDGRRESLSLVGGVPVATFDAEVHRLLRDLGVDVEILEKPFGVPMTTPFPKDTEHAAWDHDAVGRFGHILDWSDTVFEEFSGWFNGKTSPVHFFWHGFDLAVSRFSGRPSGSSSDDPVTREAYSHEVISFGFWPGDDTTISDAAYYSYTAPEPPGLREQPLAVGFWKPSGASSSLAILPYEEVQTSDDPRRTLLAFCESLRSRCAARRLGCDSVHVERMSEPHRAARPTGSRRRAVRPSASGDRRDPLVAASSPLRCPRSPRAAAFWRAEPTPRTPAPASTCHRPAPRRAGRFPLVLHHLFSGRSPDRSASLPSDGDAYR